MALRFRGCVVARERRREARVSWRDGREVASRSLEENEDSEESDDEDEDEDEEEDDEAREADRWRYEP